MSHDDPHGPQQTSRRVANAGVCRAAALAIAVVAASCGESTGAVQPRCLPSCEGKTCGGDGCGGTCGACANPGACQTASCVGGVCVTAAVANQVLGCSGREQLRSCRSGAEATESCAEVCARGGFQYSAGCAEQATGTKCRCGNFSAALTCSAGESVCLRYSTTGEPLRGDCVHVEDKIIVAATTCGDVCADRGKGPASGCRRDDSGRTVCECLDSCAECEQGDACSSGTCHTGQWCESAARSPGVTAGECHDIWSDVCIGSHLQTIDCAVFCLAQNYNALWSCVEGSSLTSKGCHCQHHSPVTACVEGARECAVSGNLSALASCRRATTGALFWSVLSCEDACHRAGYLRSTGCGAGAQGPTCICSGYQCQPSCATGQTCVQGSSSAYCCTPSCTGKQCGGDGCGGSCGACPSGLSCSYGACRDTCRECLAACRGLPSCCTGTGCICDSAC
jgi:hypothetical protein